MKLPQKRMLVVNSIEENHIDELRLFSQDTSLPKLQAAVGGFVEAIDLPILRLTMWVNEEGKLKSLPINYLATAVWANEFGVTDIILGNAVFTGLADRNGYTKGLTDSDIEALKQFFANIRENLVISDH